MNVRRWLDDVEDPALRELRRGLDEAQQRTGDQVARRRVWARVSLPGRPAKAGPARWIAATALTAAAAAAIILAMRSGPEARSTSVVVHAPVRPPARIVEVASPSVTDLPAAMAMAAERPALLAPAVVRTGDDEHMRLQLGHGAEAEVGAASILALDVHGEVSVRKGEVLFQVAKQPPGERFSVAAGAFRIVVVGTRFRVTVRGEKVSVAVEEGVVEVWRGRRLAQLSPGDSWSSGASHSTIGARSEPPGSTPTVSASPSDLLAKARAALAAGDARGAVAFYEALAATEGPAAENAQYEIGRILRERLGQPRVAVTAWERYRTKHPAGLLRTEADLSIIETLVSMGENSRASSEASAFLRRYPSSERRGEVAKLAGDLARARGDCRAAAQAYRTAVAAPGSRDVADHSAFHRAACLGSLGDPSGASELQAYLKDFPSGRFRPEAGRLLRSLQGSASSSERAP